MSYFILNTNKFCFLNRKWHIHRNQGLSMKPLITVKAALKFWGCTRKDQNITYENLKWLFTWVFFHVKTSYQETMEISLPQTRRRILCMLWQNPKGLVSSLLECFISSFVCISLEEFHQHVVLAYAENIFVIYIFDLLNPNPNDASAYMLSVLRFGWKNAVFG